MRFSFDIRFMHKESARTSSPFSAMNVQCFPTVNLFLDFLSSWTFPFPFWSSFISPSLSLSLGECYISCANCSSSLLSNPIPVTFFGIHLFALSSTYMQWLVCEILITLHRWMLWIQVPGWLSSSEEWSQAWRTRSGWTKMAVWWSKRVRSSNP